MVRAGPSPIDFVQGGLASRGVPVCRRGDELKRGEPDGGLAQGGGGGIAAARAANVKSAGSLLRGLRGATRESIQMQGKPAGDAVPLPNQGEVVHGRLTPQHRRQMDAPPGRRTRRMATWLGMPDLTGVDTRSESDDACRRSALRVFSSSA